MFVDLYINANLSMASSPQCKQGLTTLDSGFMESQCLANSPLVPLGWDTHQALAHKFLQNASVVLIREHGGTHLAETAPPGIIFPLHAYFFSDFLPFPDEGAMLGSSELEDKPARAFEETVEQGGGSSGNCGAVCRTVEPGIWGSLVGGGGGVPEDVAVGVSMAGDSVVVTPWEGAGLVATVSVGGEGGDGARPTSRTSCSSPLLWDLVMPESSVSGGRASGTRSRTANGVAFGALNTSAL